MLVEHPRVAVGAPDVVEGDSPPVAARRRREGGEQLGAAPTEGDEVDVEFVEAGKVGVGGQQGVEGQFAGPDPGAPPPLLGEAQDLDVLGGLAEGGGGIADMK